MKKKDERVHQVMDTTIKKNVSCSYEKGKLKKN